MKNIIQQFVDNKNSILKAFKLDDDLYIQPMLEYNWLVREDDGIYFLRFWKDNEMFRELVIVRKNGEPNVNKSGECTAVVALDCVKIAFIFDNGKKE